LTAAALFILTRRQLFFWLTAASFPLFLNVTNLTANSGSSPERRPVNE